MEHYKMEFARMGVTKDDLLSYAGSQMAKPREAAYQVVVLNVDLVREI